MKTCFKCREAKPFSEFYRHPRMSDGHLGKCKECTKNDARRHRAVSPEPRKSDRRRFKQSVERRAKNKQSGLAWRRKNPEKRSAISKVNYAVGTGRLVKTACSVCGETDGVIGHHEDYAKPLEVVWMCKLCHGRHHYAKPWREPLKPNSE